MPERLLDVGRVGTASQEQRRVRVPEIMPPCVGQLRSLEQGLEEPVDYVLCVEGSTLALGKYES